MPAEFFLDTNVLVYTFYDSLIMAGALASGARVLYTEDLQAGREFRGLRIENPFESS